MKQNVTAKLELMHDLYLVLSEYWLQYHKNVVVGG